MDRISAVPTVPRPMPRRRQEHGGAGDVPDGGGQSEPGEPHAHGAHEHVREDDVHHVRRQEPGRRQTGGVVHPDEGPQSGHHHVQRGHREHQGPVLPRIRQEGVGAAEDVHYRVDEQHTRHGDGQGDQQGHAHTAGEYPADLGIPSAPYAHGHHGRPADVDQGVGGRQHLDHGHHYIHGAERVGTEHLPHHDAPEHRAKGHGHGGHRRGHQVRPERPVHQERVPLRHLTSCPRRCAA